jgi:uncharacterized protein YggU (UPF0235/DUF167 family)
MEIKESRGSVSFAVRVSPRASREAIEGEHAGALKVRLTAPPVEDRANESLCGFWRSGWRSRSPLLESWRAKRTGPSKLRSRV